MEASTITLKPRLRLRVSPDGPYFDLEFALEENGDSSSGRASSSSCDELFFIKRVLDNSYSSNKPLATRFRYFLLRFKNHIISPSRHQKVEPEQQEKEEVVAEEQEQFHGASSIRSSDTDTDTATKKYYYTGKEVIHKYLSKIKPLYVRVSRRYADKLRFSGQLTPAADKDPSVNKLGRQFASSPVANIRRRLRKCRSASAAVAGAAPSPPPRRRDDSLVRHEEDGIESAIAHCKRSFNSDKGSDSGLVRSKSDPGGGRAGEPK